ncbi:cytochrome-c oxidase, cbb3-type subunit II [Plasticicumulans sp.]|uniref:cytochrome-c oxidase, cbb3-type subunit II n=1 Tax=Plasticicumulans sp. TaxID=2307179 RepID=UPI000F96C538|nr:cytochrome-c oxidase, cbb3-type subunit II [Plasticicumulans sp.]MBS0601841.1 cytochrome-c oxidase, cbb3-type subunit II [Pseudomonadota bacterium]RTL03252.1 MAG: cytochrome-c oxidase, cbb3-type subunit II [Xanthomonadales bacterium]HMV38514.1 cytochrome-c oxidase, cbb3-type subunit II [Plasticicumulans sp.]HMW28919.1 cytochrome-c oxidase, cbb3-type subunit II [Plasticicumulans sp.]HMW41169.1 cytochrome-c oxidase, cbb3-type subunit II [Plasticicumulans sp.]
MRHEHIEVNSGLMIALVLAVISIGGLVEIVPLYFINDTVEKVDGVRPYTPLELRGRDIYVREGCFLCHSQMIRPFRDEWLRYGHYSLAAESKYDHPFQWGSKRTGPDLARVGNKFSNQWHVQHLVKPTSVVPESIMPNYPWLLDTELDYTDVADRMKALRYTGVPYSLTQAEYEKNVKDFGKVVADQLDISQAKDNLMKQARTFNYDGLPDRVTEMEALVAYLQVLGTMVDFSKYDEGYFANFR